MTDFCCGMPSLFILGGIVGYFLTFWRKNGIVLDVLGLGLNIAALYGAGYFLHQLEGFSLFWAFLLGNLLGCTISFLYRHECRDQERIRNIAKSHHAEAPSPAKQVVTNPITPPQTKEDTNEGDLYASRYVEHLLRDLEVAKEHTHSEHYEAMLASWTEKGRKLYGSEFEKELKRQTDDQRSS